MVSSFCLAASLLVGQVHETTTVQEAGQTWTQQGTVQTTSQTWTWTSSTGWRMTGSRGTTSRGTTRTQDKSFMSRMGDKIGNLFGRQTPSRQSQWQTVTEEPELAEAPSPQRDAGTEAVPVAGQVLIVPPEAAPATITPVRVAPRQPNRIAVTPDGGVTIETVEPELAEPVK